MPRDGSPELPSGVMPAEPMTIGEVSNPPFAVPPQPAGLFKRRSVRMASLAPGHRLEPYLRFLAGVCDAQQRTQGSIATPKLPDAQRIATAIEHGMPPLSLGQLDLGADGERALMAFLDELEKSPDLNADTTAAIARARAASNEERRAMLRAVLTDEIPEAAVAEHVLAAAAVQVVYAGLAAQLDGAKLSRVADGACPACGGAPVASSIVGWQGSHGARFCTCSICATNWNVSRIKCLVCGNEKGIAYHSIEGSNGHISGETCESCKSYVKMLHQHKTADLEPMADDVASLDLDLTLEREGWRRASVNPFLMGY